MLLCAVKGSNGIPVAHFWTLRGWCSGWVADKTDIPGA
jgi:hypothetical protein